MRSADSAALAEVRDADRGGPHKGRRSEGARVSRGYSRRIFPRRKSRRGFAQREVLTIRHYEAANPPSPSRGLVEWIIVLGRTPQPRSPVLPPLWTMFERRRHSGNQVDSQSAHFPRHDRSPTFRRKSPLHSRPRGEAVPDKLRETRRRKPARELRYPSRDSAFYPPPPPA